MTLEDVQSFLQLCSDNNIQIWIDGGWAVDSLIGKQTRKHEDLDIALKHTQVPKLRKLLEDKGYKNVPRNDTRDCNFVLGDEHGHLIDFHSFEWDNQGKNIFGVAYSPEHLSGNGVIGNQKVQTIDPRWLVKFHTGYEIDKNDYHDVKLLCRKYGFKIPKGYAKFETK